MFLTIIVFVLVLSVLVFSHELGHFFVARRLGVKAEEFGFGLPPRIIGVYKNTKGKWRRVLGTRSSESLSNNTDEDARPAPKSTIYSLNWLPIGGFVKIKGENDNGLNEPDSFAARKIWQRTLILAAGVIMNIILAWIIFSVGYMIGFPQATENLAKNAIVSKQQLIVAQVMPDSPADKVGIKANDIILQADGEAMIRQEDLQAITSSKTDQEISILIDRNGEEEVLAVIPLLNSESGNSEIGVAVITGGLVRYPFFTAIWEAMKTTGWMLKEIVIMFIALIAGIFTNNGLAGQVAGPVGIANFTGQMARLGTVYLMQFTAFLSLNLAVLNFLPFPALDGGRILFLLIEKIKGSPVRRDVEAIIHNTGFLLLIAVVILVTYRDIIRLF